MAELVTGYAGEVHISSEDVGKLLAGTIGPGRYILPTGYQLGATVESANSVSINTGDALFDGRHVTVASAETLTIDSGTQSENRYDIVGFRYTKAAGTGIESVELVVIKGTPTSGTPSDPTTPTGSILDGDDEAFMPLWRIPVEGITIGTPVLMANTLEAILANAATTGADASFASVDASGTITGANVSATGSMRAQGSFTINGEGSFIASDTNVDATKANNNVSSAQYRGTFFNDKNGRGYASFESIVEPGGNIVVHLYARNYDTAGNSRGIQGVRIEATKSGGQTVTLEGSGARAAWLAALGLTPAVCAWTKNGSAVNSTGYMQARRQGNVVVVNFNAQLLANLSAATTLFSGLPAPANRAAFNIAKNGGPARSCYIDTNGNLVLENATNDAGWYSGTLVYMAA